MNTPLRHRLAKTFGVNRQGQAIAHADDPRINRLLFGGLETRTDPATYDWDGLRRGGDPRHPFMVFQYTLEGRGCYAQGGQTIQVPAGHAFTAIVPSAHRYYLPTESASWTFFYLLIQHDYIVSRFAQAGKRHGYVTELAPDSVALSRAAALLEGVRLRSFPDTYAAEQSLFDFMIEYERHAYRTTVSPDQCSQFLLAVRQYVLENVRRPIAVEELASRQGMSRSNYSHHFRTVTGRSPAHYVAEVRLQEASRRLLQAGLTLKVIAAETGFADANHLCKAFRRAYHVSPAQYRRQRG